MKSALCAMCVVAAAALTGCASNLPTYQWSGAADGLEVLAARAKHVQTLRSPCSIVLTDPQKRRITFDGAVAARFPGWLRLRAWKFNQAAFDLTSTPEGVWMAAPEGHSSTGLEGLHAEQVAQVWDLLGGDFFSSAGLKVSDTGGATFRVKRVMSESGSVVACEIDRKTLLARRYRVFDASGVVVFTLDLGRYRLMDGMAFPTRIEALAQHGRIEIALHDAELNGDLEPTVFHPPRRAVKQQ